MGLLLKAHKLSRIMIMSTPHPKHYSAKRAHPMLQQQRRQSVCITSARPNHSWLVKPTRRVMFLYSISEPLATALFSSTECSDLAELYVSVAQEMTFGVAQPNVDNIGLTDDHRMVNITPLTYCAFATHALPLLSKGDIGRVEMDMGDGLILSAYLFGRGDDYHNVFGRDVGVVKADPKCLHDF
jgi:hypothetical protein